MKARTPHPSTARIRVVGLLALASVFCVARPAVAQSQGECVLPAGATPVPDPRVTAQQVEEGNASLKDFVVAVRDHILVLNQNVETGTVEKIAYFGCLIRQEGSAYRSGSTFLVLLRPDGRVIWHAKAMGFSGRLLNPLIFGTILSSLGVEPSVLADLASPDPGARSRALAAVRQTLSQDPDGQFDATTPVPGLRPGIPGASGHAAAYVEFKLGVPVVLLSGFDVNESHLTTEEIDYGNPTVTAMDVVDRKTLKDFVTQAGNYYLTLAEQLGGDFFKAKVALRDENGPWRHGSVYLYILDRISNTILLHAAFPDRFELRPLVPTVRDAVTGEFILPQVIEAAKSSPDGGFVEYYFDDPADDTDSADIPKVGYAREFIGQIQRTDGTIVPLNIIVGSGFYASSTEGEVTRRFHVLPHLADGGGWRSSLLVTNVSEEANQCTLQLYGENLGTDRFEDYSAGGVTAAGSMATLELPASGGYLVWPTRGESAEASGYATLDCVHPVAAQIVFEWVGGGMRATGMATVFSSPAATVFQIPVLRPAATVGIAIANDTNFEASCHVQLSDPQGTMVGEAMLSVPMQSNKAELLNRAIPIPETFMEGSATVTCDRQVSMIGLHNELREDGSIITFTTLPPAVLSTTPATMESAAQ